MFALPAWLHPFQCRNKLFHPTFHNTSSVLRNAVLSTLVDLKELNDLTSRVIDIKYSLIMHAFHICFNLMQSIRQSLFAIEPIKRRRRQEILGEFQILPKQSADC
jgi:hypothetical protein